MSTAADSDSHKVRALMERYVEAVYTADVETLRSLFHADAFMGGYLHDDLLMGTPEPFFADLAGRASMAESGASYGHEISSLQIRGRAASVTLEEEGFFGTERFVNYFALIELEGQWKIVSKTFASL